MQTTGLAYISLFVEDVDRSKEFYVGALGLPLLTDDEWGATLQAGPVQLMIHPREGRNQRDVELVFDVVKLDEAFEELRAAGIEVLEEPQAREWGDKDGAVADPDGNRVYLRESAPSGV